MKLRVDELFEFARGLGKSEIDRLRLQVEGKNWEAVEANRTAEARVREHVADLEARIAELSGQLEDERGGDRGAPMLRIPTRDGDETMREWCANDRLAKVLNSHSWAEMFRMQVVDPHHPEHSFLAFKGLAAEAGSVVSVSDAGVNK